MGCDIHMHVCVVDEDTGKLKPVYVVGNTTGEIELNTCQPGGYFRDYDVFGLLNEIVRGGCWINGVALPHRGRLSYERFDIGNYTFEQLADDVKRFECDFNKPEVEQDLEYNGYIEAEKDLKRGLSNPYPSFIARYYYSQWYHSHTYFTVAELKKLVKRLKKYSKKIGKKSNDIYEPQDIEELQGDIKGYIASINDIINDARAYARVACDFYKPEDKDVYILCCFDS